MVVNKIHIIIRNEWCSKGAFLEYFVSKKLSLDSGISDRTDQVWFISSWIEKKL